jgi:hypothetical protein
MKAAQAAQIVLRALQLAAHYSKATPATLLIQTMEGVVILSHALMERANSLLLKGLCICRNKWQNY